MRDSLFIQYLVRILSFRNDFLAKAVKKKKKKKKKKMHKWLSKFSALV